MATALGFPIPHGPVLAQIGLVLGIVLIGLRDLGRSTAVPDGPAPRRVRRRHLPAASRSAPAS